MANKVLWTLQEGVRAGLTVVCAARVCAVVVQIIERRKEAAEAQAAEAEREEERKRVQVRPWHTQHSTPWYLLTISYSIGNPRHNMHISKSPAAGCLAQQLCVAGNS